MIQSQQSQQTRQRRLNVRLSQPEWEKIEKLSANTTCRSISEYSRKVLTQKPVRVYYRNQSFDKLEEQLAPLLPLLQTYGDDFNQLTQKLDSLRPDQFTMDLLKPLLDAGLNFSKTAEEIKTHLEKISDQSTQNSDHATQNNALPQDRP